MAEISLALGDFDNAVAASTRVIDGTDGDYHLMTTRFGSRAGEATDRYGNSLAAPAGAYWDLFREGGNQNSTDNKEAIWVCQYNYGTYSTGGGGNEWWRINANNIESVWMSTTVRNDTKKRTLSNGTQIYLWGDNVACFQPGIMGSAKSNVPSAKIAMKRILPVTRWGGMWLIKEPVLFQPIMYGIVYGKSLAKMVR